ncbi:MAG: endopeptidase La [Sphingobacteriia bacterium]|nr:endopeptidase La [Sphingobacteriia bacterium]
MFGQSGNDKIILSDIIEGETEFIPLLSQEDEDIINSEELPEALPILPLRNTVLFPGVVIPITVGRDKSIKLVREAYSKKKPIGVIAQKEAEIEEPKASDLFNIGSVASIMKVLQMPDGNTTVIIQGKKRFKLDEMMAEEPYFIAKVSSYEAKNRFVQDKNFQALISSLKDLSIKIITQSPNIPSEAAFAIKNIESPVFLVNFIASNLNVTTAEKQNLLEISDVNQRATKVLATLSKELQMLELKNQIQDKVKLELDKQHRDFILNQQLKTIQEELGGTGQQQQIEELKKLAETKKWSKDVQDVFEKEVNKLYRINPNSMDYSIQVNYLETLVELPWNEYTTDNFDLVHAQKVLDKDHFGLEKVKERIIEHLAVLKLKKDMKSPIICLTGPPGVGKTSLGKSIATAIERKYIRMSLGGLRDEAEIRGHRKTYIGAMPGRIIQSLKKARSSNPVFVLDEIDKVIGANINGDPSAALLEVLDPEQNTTFYDNFLELEFDLSRVLFLATANTLSTVHPALRDRMEVIEISGYLLEEKIEIAKRHLVPKQLKEHGIKSSQLSFTKQAIQTIIEDYTRESGVRLLEKNIAKIIRSRARFISENLEYNKKITPSEVSQILGAPKYQKEQHISNDVAGVVTGLAWTAVGGEILFVEASLSRGKGLLTMTGNLGDVMKESATIAYEYLKAHAETLEVPADIFQKYNLHIHIPEGATPKDGPSAGITIFTAIASIFTQRKVRYKIAMTGEITLRGKVLPVGGIKEKILAAKRAKIGTIILPRDNEKDILEIPEKYIKGLSFVYVDTMTDVMNFALLSEQVKNPVRIFEN